MWLIFKESKKIVRKLKGNLENFKKLLNFFFIIFESGSEDAPDFATC